MPLPPERRAAVSNSAQIGGARRSLHRGSLITRAVRTCRKTQAVSFQSVCTEMTHNINGSAKALS
eukprot:14593607-Alexandrium_andersonii.AAC.1